MMDKRTGKARHKHEPPLRLRIRWLAGTAMLLATALLVSLPLTLRTTDNIEQMFDTRAYASAVNDTALAIITQTKTNARRYNERLASGNDLESETARQTETIPEYAQQLVIPPSDIMSTIAYPRLGINLPIRHGADENSLAAGAGHWQGTSLPIGGKGTHAVITAHRGLADKLMFTKLDQARKGDEFTLTTLDETLTYRVESIRTVTPDDISWVKPETGQDKVTLLTCTPYGINTHRLLVTGTRIPNHDERSQDPGCAIANVLASTGAILAIIWSGTIAIIRHYRRIWRRRPHGYNEHHDRRSTVPTPRKNRLQPWQKTARPNRHPPSTSSADGRWTKAPTNLPADTTGRKSPIRHSIPKPCNNQPDRTRTSPTRTKSHKRRHRNAR